MPAKQTIIITRTRKRTKAKSNKESSGKKRGNNKRCPACGRYM